VNRSENRTDSVVAAIGRGAFDVTFLAQSLARPRETLLHASRRHDERRRDLVRRESDHRRERERSALAIFEGGMAAGKEKTQKLVFPAAQHIGLGDGNARPRAELCQNVDRVGVALRVLRSSQPIAMRVLRDGHEPRLDRIRPARVGPRFQRAHDRVVNGVFRVGE
jgi:hypothetical protein